MARIIDMGKNFLHEHKAMWTNSPLTVEHTIVDSLDLRDVHNFFRDHPVALSMLNEYLNIPSQFRNLPMESFTIAKGVTLTVITDGTMKPGELAIFHAGVCLGRFDTANAAYNIQADVCVYERNGNYARPKNHNDNRSGCLLVNLPKHCPQCKRLIALERNPVPMEFPKAADDGRRPECPRIKGPHNWIIMHDKEVCSACGEHRYLEGERS